MDRFKRKTDTPVLRFVDTGEAIPESGRRITASKAVAAPMPALSFPLLEDLPVRHLCTTRLGGVSSGIFKSMNLLRYTGDSEANVIANFEKVAAYMGVGRDRFVLSDQTHTANVRQVFEENAGSGTMRDRDYRDVDGLITDVPELALGIFAADCVPVFFVDPVHRAIGLSHSGWRGTVRKISQVTVGKMHGAFGTEPKDLYCALGPSICQDCYEVSEDVALQLAGLFPEKAHRIIRKGRFVAEAADDRTGQAGAGEQKYQASLWEAIRLTLLSCGVPEDHIQVTDICTCCNPDLLFSHRYTQGKRGLLGAFLMLEP